METARAFWHLDDLIQEIVSRIVASGRPASVVVDAMAAGDGIRLRPDDQWKMIRAGLIDAANDRQGMRGFRSGKVQSAGVSRRPLAEESAGLEEWADRILARLIFAAADGMEKPVTEFTHDDALAAYDRRVRAVREQADREEPFWKDLMGVTSNGWTLGRRAADVRKRLAKLAVSAGLTDDE